MSSTGLASRTEPTGPRSPAVAPAAIALAALCTAALAVLTARFNRPAVGPDAVAYVAVATSIREGNGIAFWLEDPLVTWPPLWPAMIAAGMAVSGLRADLAALVLNAVAAAGCVVTGFAVARRVIGSTRLLQVMLVSLAVSPILVGLTVLVQTEILFTLVTMGILLSLLRWIDEEHPRWLVLAGLLTVTGFFIRYQALYVVPAFAGWVCVRTLLRERSFVRAAVNGAWYAAPAVVPAAVWVARNLSVSDTALGPRFPSDVSPVSNLVRAFTTVFKFLTSLPTVPVVPSALVTVVAIGAGLLVLERRTRPPGGTSRGVMCERLITVFCGPVGLLCTFLVGFMVLMVATRSVVGFDDLDIRLLAPCLIPISILFLRYCELTFTGSAPWRRFGHAAVGVWLAAQVVVTFALVGPANHNVAEYGFNSERAVAAAHSPAIDALPDGCVAYSNNSGDLYRSGFESRLSPRTVEYKSSEPTDDLDELVAAVEGGETTCLVWVEYSEDEEFHSREDLVAAGLELVEVASADGVTTYLVEPGG